MPQKGTGGAGMRDQTYYYGNDIEQFSFYRVPRILIKDKRFKKLSSDAKILYGLMQDRLTLSQKNGWIDEKNRVYIIYTISNIMEDLGCGKDKAIKVLAELDSVKGIGLIEKVRRGLGKPDIIYVKNFIKVMESIAADDELPEVEETDLKKSENQTSGNLETELPEAGKSDSNYINKNNINNKKINMNYNDSIYPSNQENHQKTDQIDEIEAYRELIKENIDYHNLIQGCSYSDRLSIDEMVEMITETVAIERPMIRIGGIEYPYQLVKKKLLKLDDSHIRYVLECMNNTGSKIRNIKSYILTALYQAVGTIESYYQAEVRHDEMNEFVYRRNE